MILRLLVSVFGKKVCIERGFSVNFNQEELHKIINEFENIKEKCQNNKK